MSSKFNTQALTAAIQQISSEALSEKFLGNIHPFLQEKAEQKARWRNLLTPQHK
jgi:cell division inhibitor SulA